MMIAPEPYIDQFKDADYPQLIEERSQLIEAIKEFEAKELAGDRSGEEWKILPSPEVRYQMNLKYLGMLCELIAEKYNNEYIWNERPTK